MNGERTLTFDVGGSGIKAGVLGPDGSLLADQVRIRTPYPCAPEKLVSTLREVAATLPTAERLSVGLPGMIRDGRVLTTPHFITEAGPFTPVRPDLLAAWTRWDAATEIGKVFDAPVRVVNDAELAGIGVVSGIGFEVFLGFGTGLGAALFSEGRLLPKLELSQAPFRRGDSYDQQLGDHARRRIGDLRWSRRVARALGRWHAVLWWDRLFLGGGNAVRLRGDLGFLATVVPGEAGVLGGHKLWEYPGL
ncbi:MAG: ROK family protein [Sporichthyaceae bacterium]